MAPGTRFRQYRLNGEIKPGPLEIGFDYSFIIPATPDRVPCVFVENHRVVNADPADPIQISSKNHSRESPRDGAILNS